jgi:site-specific recombinase XerD
MFTEIEKYLKQIESDKSKHTLRAYTSTIERFVNACAIPSVDELCKMTSSQVQDYLYGLKNGGLSAASVNGHVRNLSAFFKWLNENGYENDIRVKRFKQAKTIKDVPTEDEIKSMIANTSGQRKLLIALIVFTGMRREEITNIKLSDISGCSIVVHGKGRKERKIPLHDDLCKLLNNWLVERDTDFEYLFFSRRTFAGQGDGTAHQLTGETINRMVKAAMLKGGVSPDRIAKMGAHSLRRFFAVYLLKNNASLTKIQLLMGHESVITTGVYLKSAGAEIAEEEIRALPSLM